MPAFGEQRQYPSVGIALLSERRFEARGSESFIVHSRRSSTMPHRASSPSWRCRSRSTRPPYANRAGATTPSDRRRRLLSEARLPSAAVRRRPVLVEHEIRGIEVQIEGTASGHGLIRTGKVKLATAFFGHLNYAFGGTLRATLSPP
jgi:hypothetical protein